MYFVVTTFMAAMHKNITNNINWCEIYPSWNSMC